MPSRVSAVMMMLVPKDDKSNLLTNEMDLACAFAVYFEAVMKEADMPNRFSIPFIINGHFDLFDNMHHKRYVVTVKEVT